VHAAHAAAHVRLILAELNLPPRWAMYLIGHTDPTLTMRVYQQVIDMGEGGLETLEKLIGCTLEEAFALLSGRGVLATNWQPANKNASQPGAWSAGRHGNAVAAGGSSKRLKGLEPSTSMASRPRLNRWIGFLPANRAKQGLWDRRVLSQISPGFDGILSTNCPPRQRADRDPGLARCRIAWRLLQKPPWDPERRSVMGRPMLGVAESRRRMGRGPRSNCELRYLSHHSGS
jgi:hypothetical protein